MIIFMIPEDFGHIEHQILRDHGRLSRADQAWPASQVTRLTHSGA
jgi:hypothetical protein